MFHLLAPSSLLSPAMPPQSVFRCNNALYSAHAIPFYGVSRAIIIIDLLVGVEIDHAETH